MAFILIIIFAPSLTTKNIFTMKNSIKFLFILIIGVSITSISCKKDPVAPSVTTSEVSNITPTSVMAGGDVTDDGGADITERGVCYSRTNANPTTSDSKTTNGTGTGVFQSQITGLLNGTTYYVRAYATNSAATSYGSVKQFDTVQ